MDSSFNENKFEFKIPSLPAWKKKRNRRITLDGKKRVSFPNSVAIPYQVSPKKSQSLSSNYSSSERRNLRESLRLDFGGSRVICEGSNSDSQKYSGLPVSVSSDADGGGRDSMPEKTAPSLHSIGCITSDRWTHSNSVTSYPKLSCPVPTVHSFAQNSSCHLSQTFSSNAKNELIHQDPKKEISMESKESNTDQDVEKEDVPQQSVASSEVSDSPEEDNLENGSRACDLPASSLEKEHSNSNVKEDEIVKNIDSINKKYDFDSLARIGSEIYVNENLLNIPTPVLAISETLIKSWKENKIRSKAPCDEDNGSKLKEISDNRRNREQRTEDNHTSSSLCKNDDLTCKLEYSGKSDVESEPSTDLDFNGKNDCCNSTEVETEGKSN